MGATAAHRAPERVADGMCTRVRAWMTDKYRRRMNGREGYITTEITQSIGKGGGGGGQKAHRKERGSWDASGVESSCLPVKRLFLLGTLGRPVLCIFHPQNKSLSHQSPTFGPILYQIHCKGPGLKTKTLQYQYFSLGQ